MAAAMEPVQIGRGDTMARIVSGSGVTAAMEPVQIGRGDGGVVAVLRGQRAAAMEPVQIGRGDRSQRLRDGVITLPQWSPSRSDGVTHC